MKKILFDLISLKSLGGTKFHGGAEYSRELLMELQRYADRVDIYYLFDADQSFIDEQIKDTIPEVRLIIISNISEIPGILVDKGFDSFISGLPYRYKKSNFGDTESFFTIHGLRRIELPYDPTELRYAINWREILWYIERRILLRYYVNLKKKDFADLLNCSTKLHILVDSEHTKFSILSNYVNIDSEKLTVSYPLLIKARAIKSYPEINNIGKYYLMVSTHRWGKNAYRAAKAFDKLISLGRLDGKIVLLGMSEKIFRKFRIKNTDRFHIESYVDRDKYEAYLKEAYALVYPTLNEGFGYPPYEAMKYGTPVAMSVASSLIEIYSRNSLFFNPTDINEIAVRILELEMWNLKEKRKDAIIAEAKALLLKQKRMTDELFLEIIGK